MPTKEFPYHDNREARNGVRGRHIQASRMNVGYVEQQQHLSRYSPRGIDVVSPQSGIDLVNLFSGVTSPRIEGVRHA